MTDEQLSKVRQNQAEQKAFEDNLHKLLNGDKRIASKPLVVGKTPNALTLGGAKAGLELTVTKAVIDKMRSPEMRDSNGKRLRNSGHFLSSDEIIYALNSLKTPVMLLKGSKDDTIVAITDIQDQRGQQVMVSVLLNRMGSIGEINAITSAYGRENFAVYLQSQIHEHNNLIAINKDKADEMLLSIGVDFPKANTFISFDNSIAYTYEIVKHSFLKKGRRAIKWIIQGIKSMNLHLRNR